MKAWNKEVFGDVEVCNQALIGEIKALDAREEINSLSYKEKLLQDQKGCELQKVMLMEEISWHKKSRVLCLMEGDQNTKFFHRMANYHRRNNFIMSISIDGTTFTSPEDNSASIVHFYEYLYSKSVCGDQCWMGCTLMFLIWSGLRVWWFLL